MKVDKFLDVINYIVCTILSVSIFLIFVPFLTRPLGLIILGIQVFVIFYLHNALNSKKLYYFFTSLLAISNTAFCVIAYIMSKNGIRAVKNTPQPNDIFDSVIFELIPTLLQYAFVFILIVTAIVVIECGISIILKNRYFKKTQSSIECADI